MGVTCVLAIPIQEGKSAKQMVDSIQNKLEQIGAEKHPNWTMDCETYQSVQPGPDNTLKFIHLLHISDSPHLTFSVLDKNFCMVSENGLDLIIDKLKAFYTPRKGGKVEVKGAKYQLGDITVRIGNVTQVSNFKGLTLEVEYMPCYDANICWSILTEFININIDSNLIIPPPPVLYEDTKQGPFNTNNDTNLVTPQPQVAYVDTRQGLFSKADTIIQYLPLLMQTKRSS